MTGFEPLSQAPDLCEVPESEEARTAFRVDGIATATWACRKLRDVEVQRAKIRATAQAEIDRIQLWAAAQDDALARDAHWFEGLLTDYALRLRADTGGRTKSVSTPYGVVKTRESTVTWDIDQDTVLAWAKTGRPELVKVVESLRLSDAKKALKVADGLVIDPATGEAVPGVRILPGGLTASVTVDLSDPEAER